MAQMMDMPSLAAQHVLEWGCELKQEWLPRSSWTECPIRGSEECLEEHDHARQCDEDGQDMLLVVATCEHVMVRTHTCECGYRRQYAGRAPCVP